jgi:hypothetical protein
MDDCYLYCIIKLRKNIEEPEMKKGMKYIIKVHKMLIEKEKVRNLLHIF